MEQSWNPILLGLIESKQIQYKSPEGWFDINPMIVLRSLINDQVQNLRIKPEIEKDIV